MRRETIPNKHTYSRRQHRTGIGLVMLAGVFWSMGGVVVRVMETQNGWQILLYRSFFVCILVLAIIFFRAPRKADVFSSFAESGLISVVAGLGMAAAFTGFILSLVHTSVANAFFLLATQPFLIALMAWIVLREKLYPSTLVAAIITLAGVTIMFHEGISTGSVKGSVYALMSALGFAVFTVALRYGRNVNMWPAVFYGGFFTLLFSVFMLINNGSEFAISANDKLWCAVLGFTQIGLGMLAYIAGSRWVSAAELGLLAMTEIVLGPLWAWLIISEVPDRGTMTGGALILGALFGLGLYRIYSAPVETQEF